MISLKNEELISLLNVKHSPKNLLLSYKLPCHDVDIKKNPTQCVLNLLKRQIWSENLYINKNELAKINRYKDLNKNYRNDFDNHQFSIWVKSIEENTAICHMENPLLGKGVFVPAGKILPKCTFIISSGIIKLNPTIKELETKVHCSALHDLNSKNKKIIGLIDPVKIGGILDLINHAPNNDEMINFNFKNKAIKERAAIANLKSTIKFYNGYAIMGLEADSAIYGGKFGKQLLWSYASPDEYISPNIANANPKSIILFDNRDEHNGKAIDLTNYSLKKISIFIDISGEIIKKIAEITRWEIMSGDPKEKLILSTEDTSLLKYLLALRSSISNEFLQSFLNKNPKADRVIFKILL